MLLLLLSCTSPSARCSPQEAGVVGIDPGPAIPVFVDLRDGDTVRGRLPLQVYARYPQPPPLQAHELYLPPALLLRLDWSQDGQHWIPIGDEVPLSNQRITLDTNTLLTMENSSPYQLRATLSNPDGGSTTQSLRLHGTAEIRTEPSTVGPCTCLDIHLRTEAPFNTIPEDLPVGPWGSPLNAQDVAQVQDRQRQLLTVEPGAYGKVLGIPIHLQARVQGDARGCRYTQDMQGSGEVAGRPFTFTPTEPTDISDNSSTFQLFDGEQAGAAWIDIPGLRPGALHGMTLLLPQDGQIWAAQAVGLSYAFKTQVRCQGSDGSSASLRYESSGGLDAAGRAAPFPTAHTLAGP